jgi:DNA-binding XRE family transcriptional regulator
MMQAELAQRIGVTRQTIIAIETRTTRSVRAKTAIGYVP